MADSQISVIPALPGYKTVYLIDNEVLLGEIVIAWRVITDRDGDKVDSYVFPILLEGAPAENFCGYLYPDGTVTVHYQTYDSIKEANAGLAAKA